jgi:hypothetical protein
MDKITLTRIQVRIVPGATIDISEHFSNTVVDGVATDTHVVNYHRLNENNYELLVESHSYPLFTSDKFDTSEEE